jgi:ubiquinone/menaquinone biosynthesis C-methylase UbiE
MRVLDVGCGVGNPPVRANLFPSDDVIGIDVSEERLVVAKSRFPERTFLRAQGERLPFKSEYFLKVVSAVALPFMNISRTLEEIQRVLVPGGTIFLSLHPIRFTLHELRQVFPRPMPTLYRLGVIVRGVIFHLFAYNWSESFQTERGKRGFSSIVFQRPNGRLLVEATKE